MRLLTPLFAPIPLSVGFSIIVGSIFLIYAYAGAPLPKYYYPSAFLIVVVNLPISPVLFPTYSVGGGNGLPSNIFFGLFVVLKLSTFFIVFNR